jgi:plastocyanin
VPTARSTEVPSALAPTPQEETHPAAGRRGTLSIELDPAVTPVASEIPVRLTLAVLGVSGAPIHGVAFNARVTNGAGTVVYSADGLRDEQGVHRFWLGPLASGHYRVEAAANPTDDTPSDDDFTGPVEKSLEFDAKPAGPLDTIDLGLSVDGARAGVATRIAFAARNTKDGKAIVQTDNYVEIRKGALLVFRSGNLHAPNGNLSFQYGFAEAGAYQVTLSTFPARSGGPTFKPISKSLSVNVGAAGPAGPAAKPARPNVVAPERGPGPALIVTAGPAIGPAPAELPVRISVEAVDAARQPIPDLDLDLVVKDTADAVVFAGNGIRMVDGREQLWVGPLKTGYYRVTAKTAPSADASKQQAQPPTTDAAKPQAAPAADTPQQQAAPAADPPKEKPPAVPTLTSERVFEVLPAGFDQPAELNLSVTPPRPGVPSTIRYGLTSPADGAPIVGSEGYLTIFRDGLMVYQVSGLRPQGPVQTIDYNLADPGNYTISMTALPTPMQASHPFAPVGRTIATTVAPPVPARAQTATARATPTVANKVMPIVEVTVGVKDLRFEPSTMEVARGSVLRLTLSNTSVLPHNFAIGDLKFDMPTVDGGKKVTQDVTLDQPGEYQYVCTVLGHKEAGMVGKLVVK